MPRKKAEPQPPSFRDDLFRYCVSCLPEDQKHVTVKRYAKNDMIQIKRYEAFFRLYISDTGLRASIRMNTVNCIWRIDDEPLLNQNPKELRSTKSLPMRTRIVSLLNSGRCATSDWLKPSRP